MAHIAILMLWEAGHLLPTFRIGRDLASRGHQVTYLTIPSLGDLVRSHGFSAMTILAHVFPLSDSVRLELSAPRAQKKTVLAFRETLRERTVESQIEGLNPDLVLVDSIFNSTFVASLAARLPVLVVTTSLPNERAGGLAPLTTDRFPPESVADRIGFEILWAAYFAKQRWQTLITHQLLPPLRLQVDLPELVLCPRELDFPRPKPATRYYVGPSIDFSRPRIEFPWARLRNTGRLIYCALGNQVHRYAERGRLVDSLVKAVACRRDESLVITVDRTTLDSLGSLPENIVAVEYAPQLELLPRAAVAVIHGGLGTVKECVFFGVPMIVCPQAFDQAGNAARVEYHGLGVRLRGRAATRPLRQLLDLVQQSPEIRESTMRMRQSFQAADSNAPATDIIEDYIERGCHARTAK